MFLTSQKFWATFVPASSNKMGYSSISSCVLKTNQLLILKKMKNLNFLSLNHKWKACLFAVMFTSILSLLVSEANAQTEFWFEDFGTGCDQGQPADGFNSANGLWSVNNTGANGTDANTFFVSSTTQVGATGCATDCGGDNRRTLHVSNVDLYLNIFGTPVLIMPADGGAVYLSDVVTNRRVESPVIDCSGYSAVTVGLDYIEFGHGSHDNARIWYYDGTEWTIIDDMPKTVCCGGPCHAGNPAEFDTFSIVLPASANNNPNVRIAFDWTNNSDSQGSDPSFAVDQISISGSESSFEEIDPPVNNDCENAEELSIPTFPETANMLGSLYGATVDGGVACNGSVNGGDVFYSFTLAQKNHVTITVNPFSGADVVVEVLDGCDGSTVACINNVGADESENELLENLAAGNYIVRIHNESGIPESEGTASFLINVQQFPFATVQDNPNSLLFACNQSDFQLEDFVGANLQTEPWVLDYQWLIGEVGGGVLNEWQRGESNYSTRLSWLGVAYSSTYNVFIRVLIDHPVHGEIWSLYPGDPDNPNSPGASSCTISTSFDITPTELRPNYTPTNASGDDYSLCDIAVANNIELSENFRWRFDPDIDFNNGNEIFYTRGSANPQVRLSWVNGLTPGITYNVAVEAQVAGQWSGFSTVLPMNIALPPNNVTLRSGYCGGTYAPNGYILAQSVCNADFYTYELVNTVSGSIHSRTSANYVAFLNGVSPSLIPGDYNVRVKVNQNGVPGDFGPPCVITISGPTAPGNDSMPAMRSVDDSFNSSALFPNPNMGDEVRVQLEGLSDGNHEVNIVVYDLYGKHVSSEGFGHEGTQLSRLVRFDGDLATGMYMVQILVDGEQYAVERLIVK